MSYWTNLSAEQLDRIADAAAAGRSKSIMDEPEMNELLGALYAAVNDLAARVYALGGGSL